MRDADETRTVRRYEWTDDPRWLLYLQDDGGDENWHVHRVDLDDAAAPAVDLTPYPGAQVLSLDLAGARPGKAIVALNARTMTAEGDIELSRFDTGSAELHPVARFDGDDHIVDVFPFELTPDGTGAWIGSSRGTDRTRLVRVDLATGEESGVDSHPSFDLDARSQVFRRRRRTSSPAHRPAGSTRSAPC